jgi:hypothetical protein
MKVTYRVPTKEQYAYIEIEQEMETLDGVLISENYKDLTEAIKSEPDIEGLPPLEFNRVLDKYLWQNNIDVGDFEQLNKAQQAVLQEIKKSKARNK